MQEQILAALKKLGPSSPGQVAAELGIKDTTGRLSHHFKALLDAGTIKASGASRARRLALPEQDFAEPAEAAPPQRRKAHGKRKAGRKAKHAPLTAREEGRPARATRRRAARALERFIPTVDGASRLIIVNGAEPHIFTEAETAAIASLLFQHYDKA